MTEIVAPVGNYKKLQVALNYGADAVYLAAEKYGLRYGADNFSFSLLEAAALECNKRGVKLYLAMNIFPLRDDIDKLPAFLKRIENIPITAVICSDIGIVSLVQRYTAFAVHLSTQISTLNSYQARLFKSLGVKRVVLGRETSLAQAKIIKEQSGLEIEMFIHGAMCSSISGQCTLSNYQNGRDSNRGGCIQNCRFNYGIASSEGSANKELTDFAIGSKDLAGISQIREFEKCGIDAMKIEGRMKSPLYLATVLRAYRLALDHKLDSFDAQLAEFNAINNRGYSLGFLSGNSADTINYGATKAPASFAGIVLKQDDPAKVLLFTANQLKAEDKLEFLMTDGSNLELRQKEFYDLQGNSLKVAANSRAVYIKSPFFIPENTVARVEASPN